MNILKYLANGKGDVWMTKRLIFEMSAIEFIDWLNENSLYIAYVSAIMNKELNGDVNDWKTNVIRFNIWCRYCN